MLLTRLIRSVSFCWAESFTNTFPEAATRRTHLNRDVPFWMLLLPCPWRVSTPILLLVPLNSFKYGKYLIEFNFIYHLYTVTLSLKSTHKTRQIVTYPSHCHSPEFFLLRKLLYKLGIFCDISKYLGFVYLTYTFQPHSGLRVDSASNRSESQESSWEDSDTGA
jgi:hypothetical protein